MAAVEQHVEEFVFRYTTEGAPKAKAEAEGVAGSLDRVTVAQDKATASNDKGSAASDRSTQAKARQQAQQEKYQRQLDMEARALAQVQAAQDAATVSAGGLTAAQQRAAQSAAAVQSASNDNVQALGKQNAAYQEAGKFALAHPTLVLAASALAARALSGYAATAATSLGAASASTAAYAATAGEMGTGVAAGATIAARGLGVAATAAGVAATGFTKYSEATSSLSLATALLMRGLTSLPVAFGPIAAAFAIFEIGRAAIGKAYNDFDRLIDLAQKAQGLDIAAPFVKSFESLGKQIGATTEEMDKALSTASAFVKDQYGGPNAALKQISELYTQGAFGAEKPASMSALETANTQQEKIRATLDAAKELYRTGQEFAALDLASKLFGPEIVDRLRTSNMSIEQFAAAVDEAASKEVLKQEQVDRALQLNKNIADTKQGIADALAVNIDFTEAALRAEGYWLSILGAVKSVVDWLNEAIKAAVDFASKVQGVFAAFGNLPIWKQITEAMDKMGLMDKDWRKQGETDSDPLVIKVKPTSTTSTIGSRSFPYDFGPHLSDAPKTEAAKQAKQAAQDATSAYDSLIQRTKDHIEEMDLETRSVGMNTDAVIKMKLAHDLQRAAEKSGIDVTDAMRQKWDELGTSVAASTDALAKAKRGLELTKEAQRELSDDFSTFADDVILGGKKIGQAFADLSKTLASSSLKALLTGQGGLAGLFGTAGEKSGDIGGLLGGRLGSLFGGSDGVVQGPTQSGQTLDQDSGILDRLFDTDKITKALNLGASDGLGKAVSDALKPTRAGGGILSSPLGQGLATVGAGASVGYSSQSPMMGALAGGLAGLASGDPILAIAGAGAGAIGSIPSSKKDRRHESRQRLRDLA